MKLFTASAAILCALGLSACGMLGGNEGPAPDSPAARAPAALPPPMTPAPAPSATPAPAAAPLPEDIPAVPAAQVKCIAPFVLQTTEKDGATEARCVAPQSKPAQPQ